VDAIAILLSGSGSDGRRGLAAVHEAGGLTMVQDETATFGDMAQAAITAGVVDRVLGPQAIAAELTEQLRPITLDHGGERRATAVARPVERDLGNAVGIGGHSRSSGERHCVHIGWSRLSE
jgi:hypothetical protein